MAFTLTLNTLSKSSSVTSLVGFAGISQGSEIAAFVMKLTLLR